MKQAPGSPSAGDRARSVFLMAALVATAGVAGAARAQTQDLCPPEVTPEIYLGRAVVRGATDIG